MGIMVVIGWTPRLVPSQMCLLGPTVGLGTVVPAGPSSVLSPLPCWQAGGRLAPCTPQGRQAQRPWGKTAGYWAWNFSKEKVSKLSPEDTVRNLVPEHDVL